MYLTACAVAVTAAGLKMSRMVTVHVEIIEIVLDSILCLSYFIKSYQVFLHLLAVLCRLQ